MLRVTLFSIAIFALLMSCTSENSGEGKVAEAEMTTPVEAPSAEKLALAKEDPTGSYGAALELAENLSLETLLADPAAYAGKRVRVSGKVADSCPMRGCWIDVADAGNTIRFKVKDGDMVFPLSSQGHRANVEGIVEKIELTEEKAVKYLAHLAEEKGEAFDSSSVSGPLTIWRLNGIGAEIAAI
ncbi:MAG: DUF4920 domain-containing protein [Calditrichia bacterium]